jgi:hypothetical protein
VLRTAESGETYIPLALKEAINYLERSTKQAMGTLIFWMWSRGLQLDHFGLPEVAKTTLMDPKSFGPSGLLTLWMGLKSASRAAHSTAVTSPITFAYVVPASAVLKQCQRYESHL